MLLLPTTNVLYFCHLIFVFCMCSREWAPEMQKSLERIIDIWSQRGVYDSEFIEKLQKAMGRLKRYD